MVVRPPRILAPKRIESPLDALHHEMLEEKAGALSRMVRRFEEALQEWRRLAEVGEGSDDAIRQAALDRAAEALWALIVQRDVLGLPGTERLLREYDVPPVLRARLGIVQPGGRRR
ncbi:DUF6665 family protein [Afifella sp. IM 167]|uniref:DUF6665 family protein n=1 Tax=Afifella sp. IM 167 TaxID=2033586 RepID=UPI001CCBAE87|nr:DUF6665 family protein [Afifella sp. IM 167]MBZ8134922.1 hypothetical protein [Afifella sp. IM 167]